VRRGRARRASTRSFLTFGLPISGWTSRSAADPAPGPLRAGVSGIGVTPACLRAPDRRFEAPGCDGEGGWSAAVAGRCRRGRDPSIALMTESALSDASFLLRNVVDLCPRVRSSASSPRAGPLRVKLGIDPTAPRHPPRPHRCVRKLRDFQDAGHTVVLIIGDYTARVGDPAGVPPRAPFSPPEEIDHNAETYKQAGVRDPRSRTARRCASTVSGSTCRCRSSSGSRAPRPSPSYSIATTFATRFSEHAQISILELLYPLLQGTTPWPSRGRGARGTEQKFNLLLARDIQEAYGVQQPQVAITMPILTGIDGVKRMSKSLANYVAVSEPPEEQFGS